MKCYRIDDGATYWVAANGRPEALMVWATHVDEENDELDDTLMHQAITVREATKFDLDTAIKDEETGDLSLRSALSLESKPTIIACSEWP